MKKIIRWLADVSGVTQEIKIEAHKQCGHSMYQNAYWWNGGIMHNKPMWPVWNAFFLYAEHLKNGWHGPIGNGMMDLREKVYKAGDTQIESTPH